MLPQEIPEFSVSCFLDLPNQLVIRTDIERTRNGLLNKQEKYIMQLLLTYYCKEKSISYKQGLNELLAPFVVLMKEGCGLNEIYLMFSSFVDKFLHNVFVEEDFRVLEALLMLLRLFVRYYDPEVLKFLNENGIGPELFATPWFLTLFANKISDIELLYELWDFIIEEKDPFNSLFISVSFLLSRRNEILRTHASSVPQTISQFEVTSLEELQNILSYSSELKRNLPYSIYLSLKSLDLFNIHKLDWLIPHLEKQYCLSVHPRELVQRAFPNLKCECEGQCEWCSSCKINIPFILVDCRTLVERQAGVIHNSLLLEEGAFKDINTLLAFPDQYSSLKGIFHFGLMGSKPSSSDKDIDVVEHVVNNLYAAFNSKNFPYVSIVDGGYKACHDLILKYNLKIEKHNPQKCLACGHSTKEISKVIRERFNTLRRSFLGKMKKAFSFAEFAFKTVKVKPKVPRNSISMQKQSNLLYKKQFDSLIRNPKVCFFNCKKFDRAKEVDYPENYILVVTPNRICLCTPFHHHTSGEDLPVSIIVEHCKLVKLLKITSKKNNPSTLTFYFFHKKEITLSYSLEDKNTAKNCIELTTNYFNVIRDHQSLRQSLK